jgi:hypothetical protein
MSHRKNILILTCLVVFLLTSTLPALAQSKAERVRFTPGRSSTVLKGRILGFNAKDYLIGAKAGQVMTLRLSRSNPYAYFVVYSINGRPTDMNETTEWSETLTETGDYVIRVFMMRAGARRKGASASYRLNVSIQ